MAIIKPLTGKSAILRGKTFRLPIYWETEPIIRKPITAISLDYGAPRLTVTGHGAVNGWRGYVVLVNGMKQINAPAKVSDKDYREFTVIDANTIEFNSVTPVDDNGREWPAYTGGGFLVYNTPRDLDGWICRVKFKDKPGGSVLLSTEVADDPLDLITATVDNATKTILITIPASVTATMAKKGVWEAEMADNSVEPVVEPLILVSDFEVTTEVVT